MGFGVELAAGVAEGLTLGPPAGGGEATGVADGLGEALGATEGEGSGPPAGGGEALGLCDGVGLTDGLGEAEGTDSSKIFTGQYSPSKAKTA